MTQPDLDAPSAELPGAPGWRARAVSSEEWSRAARELAESGARLAALWAGTGEHGAPTSASGR